MPAPTIPDLQRELLQTWEKLPKEIQIVLQIRAQQILMFRAPDSAQYASGLRYCLNMAHYQIDQLERLRKKEVQP